MSESSRIETLLEALVDGEKVDVVPQSRIETYLLALLNGDTNVKEPQSRIEAYLYQLCKNGMSGGGITPTGTLEITENGTHDVTNYASANVNVASSGGGSDLDALIDGSSNVASGNIKKIRSSAFRSNKYITSADFPNVETIEYEAFYSCASLTIANFPKATSVGTSAFGSCTKLTTANFPMLTSIENFLNSCSSLTSVNFRNAITVKEDAFRYVTKLESIDFPKVTTIESLAFCNCYSLKKLILRSETMCSLADTNTFAGCYHILGTVSSTYNPNGDKDGYIYVPKSLIEDYKVATNWTTYASQFRALEDYTVDGTITGELDETKI